MKIITWNINSVRLRLNQVLRLLAEENPDILCLQETKCPDDAFPHDACDAAGYYHRAIRGEKSYNGVAILSRHPLSHVRHWQWAGREDCRHLAATTTSGVEIHNFYIPAGGDIPDPQENVKFAHKLAFLEELKTWSMTEINPRSILLGDLNIAPRDDDVWSHKQLLKIVSHTPIEVDALKAVMSAGEWHDAVRRIIPEGKLYSWWSYRSRDWNNADKGRRLDHIWVKPSLIDRLVNASVLRDVRGWDKPSDHAPVKLELDV